MPIFGRCQDSNIITLKEYESIQINEFSLADLRKTDGISEQLVIQFGDIIDSN